MPPPAAAAKTPPEQTEPPDAAITAATHKRHSVMPIAFNHRRPAGFTLVELLTVIAILGVLAAIVVPIVGGVRNASRKAQSMNNLRQIGTAMQLYAADNRGHVPVWHDYNAVISDVQTGGTLHGAYWWEQLQVYLGADNEIFHSPAHVEFDASSRDRMRETISYGWNYAVAGRHVGDSSRTGDHRLNVRQFPAPPNTLIAAEGRDIGSWGYIAADAPPDANRYGPDIPSLFADGHVATLPHAELLVRDPWFTPVQELPGYN
ncbi:MAG: type II secretion system protein [Verrucomicrobiota bacterium]